MYRNWQALRIEIKKSKRELTDNANEETGKLKEIIRPAERQMETMAICSRNNVRKKAFGTKSSTVERMRQFSKGDVLLQKCHGRAYKMLHTQRTPI